MSSLSRPPAVGDMLSVVLSCLDDNKAEDVVVIDLAAKANFADFMVVASGNSQRHIGAMADHLLQALKSADAGAVCIEGMSQCDWVLIDAGDIVVHLFRPELREFYALERLWGSTADVRKRPSDASVMAG